MMRLQIPAMAFVLALAGACASESPGVPLELSNRESLPGRWLDSISGELGRCVPARFARRDTLRLPVGETRAYVAVAGRDTLERVFRAPGAYRFVLAGRLGTDIAQPVYDCSVAYTGTGEG